MTHRHPLALAGVLALTVSLAACGGSDSAINEAADDASSDDAASSSDTMVDMADPGTFPVTVDTVAGEVTIEERPERIVSLSPSATEILFAIGAGDQVIAADSYSTYPEEAPTTDLSAYEPNVEAIVGYEPDLVVISGDSNDLTASLEALDIPVIDNPAPTTIEAGWDGMAALGLATGHVDQTAETIADLRAQIEEAFAQAPDVEGLRVYHELDETFFAASSHSFIGDVYAQMGATNIADEADTDDTGYPQLTEEAIVEADPQLIVITDQVSYTADDVAARPGWSEIAAVADGDVVTVQADIASRWGPRLPELVQTLAEAMSQVAVPADS